jgi:hypothetical protein
LVHILQLEFWIFARDVLSREPIAQEFEDEIHGEAQAPNRRFAVADCGINMNSVEGHGDTLRDFEVSRKSGAEGMILKFHNQRAQNPECLTRIPSRETAFGCGGGRSAEC